MLQGESDAMKEKSEVFLTDTHAHLASARFAGDLPGVLARSHEAGVGRIVSISCDLDDVEANLTLAAAHAGIVATAGIHPCYVHEPGPSDWRERLRTLAARPEIVAIGEIGLDYYHPPEDGSETAVWRRLQESIFEEMLQLAQDLHLPAVIHSRESTPAVLDVLARFPAVRAVLHCFTGSPAEAEQALAAGHFLSFTGVITYPKADDVRATAAVVPLDRVMIETDAPYLAPVPFRGKTCEPGLVRHTCQRLAEIHGLTTEEMTIATSRNAESFFSLSGPLLGGVACTEDGCGEGAGVVL
jgi:TatD DNase family protein